MMMELHRAVCTIASHFLLSSLARLKFQSSIIAPSIDRRRQWASRQLQIDQR